MPRIWDAFCFNGEHDLLELRLHSTADVVDRFVVVEAGLTFSGRPKPLHFAENSQRYAAWQDKIVHVVAELAIDAPDAWARERQQRRAIFAALEEADADDLVLFSDVDEILRPAVLRSMLGTLEEPTRLGLGHRLYAPDLAMPGAWYHPVACRAAQLALVRRPHTDTWSGPTIDDAGLHLSFLGGAETVAAKIAAYSHQEYNNPTDNAVDHLARCIRYRVHFLGFPVLRRLPRAEWDDLVQRLECSHPGLFAASRGPSTAASKAYAVWIWLRRRPAMPAGVRRLLDRHPWVATRLLAPLLLPMYAVLASRSRRR